MAFFLLATAVVAVEIVVVAAVIKQEIPYCQHEKHEKNTNRKKLRVIASFLECCHIFIITFVVPSFSRFIHVFSRSLFHLYYAATCCIWSVAIICRQKQDTSITRTNTHLLL